MQLLYNSLTINAHVNLLVFAQAYQAKWKGFAENILKETTADVYGNITEDFMKNLSEEFKEILEEMPKRFLQQTIFKVITDSSEKFPT